MVEWLVTAMIRGRTEGPVDCSWSLENFLCAPKFRFWGGGQKTTLAARGLEERRNFKEGTSADTSVYCNTFAIQSLIVPHFVVTFDFFGYF